MASVSVTLSDLEPRSAASSRAFALAVLLVAFSACLLAGWAPLGFSIVTVFLFAGPHNWFEARYFMARMPARWGPLRSFFLTGIVGVLTLTASFALLGWLSEQWQWDTEQFQTAIATWNTGLILWIVALANMRARQNPRRDWAWLAPAGLALIAVAWLWPRHWDLGLVYLHPLIALWFLDRELGRQHSAWRPTYRRCLACLPILLAVLWWQLWDSPPLPGSDPLSQRITDHAGAGLLTGVSSHLLVATHTFLEMLHYGVWLVAIPLVSIRMAPWRLQRVPLARRSSAWHSALTGVMCLGAIVVLTLWAAFLADYPLTRDVYFTVAMLHVLAEVPFLLRLL